MLGLKPQEDSKRKLQLRSLSEIPAWGVSASAASAVSSALIFLLWRSSKITKKMVLELIRHPGPCEWIFKSRKVWKNAPSQHEVPYQLLKLPFGVPRLASELKDQRLKKRARMNSPGSRPYSLHGTAECRNQETSKQRGGLKKNILREDIQSKHWTNSKWSERSVKATTCPPNVFDCLCILKNVCVCVKLCF